MHALEAKTHTHINHQHTRRLLLNPATPSRAAGFLLKPDFSLKEFRSRFSQTILTFPTKILNALSDVQVKKCVWHTCCLVRPLNKRHNSGNLAGILWFGLFVLLCKLILDFMIKFETVTEICSVALWCCDDAKSIMTSLYIIVGFKFKTAPHTGLWSVLLVFGTSTASLSLSLLFISI